MTTQRLFVFLLTCWQEEGVATDLRRWRFLLEAPDAAERYGFADLDTLAAFLQARLQQSGNDGKKPFPKGDRQGR